MTHRLAGDIGGLTPVSTRGRSLKCQANMVSDPVIKVQHVTARSRTHKLAGGFVLLDCWASFTCVGDGMESMVCVGVGVRGRGVEGRVCV